jgi:hypothetical protein
MVSEATSVSTTVPVVGDGLSIRFVRIELDQSSWVQLFGIPTALEDQWFDAVLARPVLRFIILGFVVQRFVESCHGTDGDALSAILVHHDWQVVGVDPSLEAGMMDAQ